MRFVVCFFVYYREKTAGSRRLKAEDRINKHIQEMTVWLEINPILKVIINKLHVLLIHLF